MIARQPWHARAARQNPAYRRASRSISIVFGSIRRHDALSAHGVLRIATIPHVSRPDRHSSSGET